MKCSHCVYDKLCNNLGLQNLHETTAAVINQAAMFSCILMQDCGTWALVFCVEYNFILLPRKGKLLVNFLFKKLTNFVVCCATIISQFLWQFVFFFSLPPPHHLIASMNRRGKRQLNGEQVVAHMLSRGKDVIQYFLQQAQHHCYIYFNCNVTKD